MTRFFTLLLLFFTTVVAQAQLSTITKVTLEFTSANGVLVTASATDSGNGLALDNPINLMESTNYTLAIKLNSGETDITSEITNNANNFQFFFETTEGQFEGMPTYTDSDSNGLPIGLATSWTTACVGEVSLSGNFRIWLNSFAGDKAANSTIANGTNLFDLSWVTNVANDADAPECENEEEVIDRVTLTFTPTAGGTPVVAVASDPDGPGPQDLVVETISLKEGEYEMSIKLENTIEGEDITEEIREEDEDHLFLFGWTGDVFTDPIGDGNIDNRVDAVNYNDQDSNGLPVGLSTQWTVGGPGSASGTLRIVLKHQPELKSATSGFELGGTDVDITWNINSIVTNTDNLNNDQKLVIAPNPVQQQVRLLTENLELQNSEVIIYNTLGMVVKTVKTREMVIPVQDLGTGQYILSIQGESWNAVRRFTKIN